jgi:signal transduction histidine kinase
MNSLQLTFCLGFTLLTCYTRKVSAGEILTKITAGENTRNFEDANVVHLKALDNDVIFEFSPIQDSSDFYEYKLSGFDKAWIRSKHSITRYTNLPGGKYSFAIRLTHGHHVGKSEHLTVLVEKELTEEWWFIPLISFYIILIIGAAIYFFLLYNMRQKLKLHAIRYKIASDLHDEVGATLSSISISVRLINRKLGNNDPEIGSILDRIKSDSEESIDTIRDTVWAINPDNDNPAILFEKMRSFGFQLLSSVGVAFEFENKIISVEKLKLSMEQRRNVFLLFKEAINNIAKHASASNVFVCLDNYSEGIHLLITDDGIGFDTEQIFEGNGLKNFRNREKESFMDLTVSSRRNAGTRIEVQIPEM